MKKLEPQQFKQLMAVLGTLLLISIISVIQPLIIPLLGAIVYLIYKMYHNENQDILITENAVKYVYLIAIRIFAKLENQIGIEPPKTLSDVCSDPMTVLKQGLPFIRTKVRLKPNKKQDLTELPAIMRLIQTTLNNALVCGELDDLVHVRSANNRDPILIVESVFFEDGYLVVDFAVLNNQKIYNYLCKSQQTRNISSQPIAKPSKEDIDF
jgi:hypothetical protein